MSTGKHLNYWVIKWSSDWDPWLAGLLPALLELVLGRGVAITSSDSGPCKPTDVQLETGWSRVNDIAISLRIQAVSALPTLGFDEWYVFVDKPKVCPKRSFVNRWGSLPWTQGKISRRCTVATEAQKAKSPVTRTGLSLNSWGG
jgi:hypothetical protein